MKLEVTTYDFEKERLIALAGKEAKEMPMLFNLPANDVQLVRRYHMVTTPDGVGSSYLLPSPADLALEEHERPLKKKDGTRAGVPHHVEPCISGYQNDWYGIARPYRNLGVPGDLPFDEGMETSITEEVTSPRTGPIPGLTMPDQTARLNFLFVPPAHSFVVPRMPLQPAVYETGPNADPSIIESLSSPMGTSEDGSGDTEALASSEEPSMIETGASSYGGTSSASFMGSSALQQQQQQQQEEEKKKMMRHRSVSEAVQINIRTLNDETSSKEGDAIDPSLLAPPEQGKAVLGVHRDLLFGQLYPLPDAPPVTHPADADISSLGMRFKITPKSLSFVLGDLEPFFGILALFDLSTGERISENFYFDLNGSLALSSLPTWFEHSLEGETGRAVRSGVDALFWVPHPSPDIWLVLRVEKVLQGDSYDNVIEPYMRSNTEAAKGKDLDKLKSNIYSFTERLGPYRQPFCWGMTPIFTEDKQFAHGSGAIMKQLNRYKGGDITNSVFLEASAEVKTGSKRLKWVPGQFIFDLSPVQDTSVTAACNQGQALVDWTGRLCTKPYDEENSGIDEQGSGSNNIGGGDGADGGKHSRTKSHDDTTAGSDEESASGSSSSSKQKDKKSKKLRKERSSQSVMTGKAAKLLGGGGSSSGGSEGTSNLYPYLPDYYPMNNYVQQIGCFPAPGVPFSNPHNVAYIYPTNLSVSKTIGNTVARNLLIQVSLLAHEDDELEKALMSVYTRAHVNPLSQHAYSVVNYHDRTPSFYDEFKLALPNRVTKNHVLRFTFYHVQCQSKSSSSSSNTSSSGTGSTAITPQAIAAAAAAAANPTGSSSASHMIGYSIFPLLNDGTIPEGEITLHIFPVGDVNSMQPGSSGEKGSSSSGAKGPAELKKTSFTFRLKLASSIYTADKYLHPFFAEYGNIRASKPDPATVGSFNSSSASGTSGSNSARDTPLQNALRGLEKVLPRKLLQFLPIILHQLFYVMCTQPEADSNRAFNALVQVLNKIYQKEAEMQVTSLSSVLQHYIDYLFMSPPNVAPLFDTGSVTFHEETAPPSIANTLYKHMTRAWLKLCESTIRDHDHLYRFSWFFFKLIYASSSAYAMNTEISDLKDAPDNNEMKENATATLLASAASAPPVSTTTSTASSTTSTPDSSPSKGDAPATQNQNSSSPPPASAPTEQEDPTKDSHERITRFSSESKLALKKLVMRLARTVQERLGPSLKIAKELSRKIAAFLVDMLAISDRGFIIDLAIHALKEIAPREDEICWELRASFWRTLSSYEHWPQLALPTTFHIDSKNVGNLEEVLAQKQYLQGAILKDLIFAPITDKTSRLRGLHILQSLFMKADLDPRLNPALMTSIRLSQDGRPPAVTQFDLEDAVLANIAASLNDINSFGSSSSSSSSSSGRRSSRRSVSRRSGTLRTKRAGIQHMALSDPTTSNYKTMYLQGFFPFLLRGVDQVETLKRADFDEQRVFLSCWIYLIKNTDVRLLRQWWKSDSFIRNAGFLQMLALCSQVFEYQGYLPLVQKLNSTAEVTRAVATKALIEELYSDLSASNPGQHHHHHHHSGASGAGASGSSASGQGSGAAPSLSLRQKRGLETLKMKGTSTTISSPTTPVNSTSTATGTNSGTQSTRGASNEDGTSANQSGTNDGSSNASSTGASGAPPSSARAARLAAMGASSTSAAQNSGANSGSSGAGNGAPSAAGSLSQSSGAAFANMAMRGDDLSTQQGQSSLGFPSLGAAGSARTRLALHMHNRRNQHHHHHHGDKDYRWKHPGLDSERGRYESNPTRESRISHEVSVTILDCLEWYMVAKESDLNTNAQANALMDGTVSALLGLLGRRQAIDLQIMIFRVLTTFAHIFVKQLFVLSSSYVGQLMPRVLGLCNYENDHVRMGASAFFFLMLKLNLENSPVKNRNFTRVKVQAIIALSKLVAGQAGIRDLSFLNRALNSVQLYATSTSSSGASGSSASSGANSNANSQTPGQTSSPAPAHGDVENPFLVLQVNVLSERLRAIMEGSIKIQQHAGDTDMLTDLYHQIASSYRTAPDLRVTWLESLAELHVRNDAWAEAGQCLVHIAALIAEYLQILEPTEGSMKGAAAFEPACVSAVEEQTMLDAQNMMDEDSVGETHIFTEEGLCDVVERAITCLTRAQLYESSHELYKLLLPVHEKAHNYAKLADSHAALSSIFGKIVESINSQSRLFGSYYRVAFFGSRFGDLDGKEYVYKEPKITRLGEIRERLLLLHEKRVGGTIEIITTSGEVDVSSLDKKACYIQITHVSPYFDDWELKQRKTDYERNNNIGRFIFETPFVKGSSSTQSPGVADQWKRKTILSVDATFPYMKRRLHVTNKETVELSPVETAIETIESRVQVLATQLIHPNAKTLPLVLQGSVRSAVNIGPTEISKTFLAPGCDKKYGAAYCDRLRIALQSFLDICYEALLKNKEITTSAQLNFHQELEDGYAATKAIIEPMLNSDSK